MPMANHGPKIFRRGESAAENPTLSTIIRLLTPAVKSHAMEAGARGPTEFARASPALLLRFLVRAHCVRRALNEGLDLHHVLVLQLAGEVRHALIAERTFEDKVLQVIDGLGRDIAEVLDVAALVDAGYAVTGGASFDIDRRSLRNIFGIVFYAREQVADLVFGEVGQRRLAADGEGIDRAWSFLIRGSLRDAEHPAPAHGDRHILHAVDGIGRRCGGHAGPGRGLPKFFA